MSKTFMVSVGYLYDYEKEKSMVGLTVGNSGQVGISPELARDLAVDLMLWADRIEGPTDTIETESK